MTSKLLLQIASILLLIHNIPHAINQIGWKSPKEPIQKQTVDVMLTNKFTFMNSTRSYGLFFEGYGYGTIFTLLLLSVLLWILSGYSSLLVKKLLIAVVIFLALWGFIEVRYFFLAAAAITLLAAILTLIAIIKINSQIKP